MNQKNLSEPISESVSNTIDKEMNELIDEGDLWRVIYSHFNDIPEDKENNLPYKKNY